MKTADGKVLKIADLVDDDPAKREKVSAALRDPAQKNNRDHVDIIIALGMAKEGFDWIWCEHALTVGYRSSLTEIVQIIGRATRDAPGKTRARFTNLIAEPDATEDAVTEAVNDTLKAIAASLLMEQVLAPRFEFRPKNPNNAATPGLDYGDGGYDPDKCNVGVNPQTGLIQLEIKGLAEPKSQEAERICREDLTELVTAFVQDKQTIERGLFDRELVPEELTQVRMGKIVKEKFPNLDEEDQEAVRQHAIAALNFVQQAKKAIGGDGEDRENTALIDGVRKFALSVTGTGHRSDRPHQSLWRSVCDPGQIDERRAAEAGCGGDCGQASKHDAGRSARPGETSQAIQRRKGTAAVADRRGPLGKANGRGDCLPAA